jgi:hypothetical protein
MRSDKLSDIDKKNQLWPAVGCGFDHAVQSQKGIIVPFRRGQIRPYEIGEQLVGSRLTIPSVV